MLLLPLLKKCPTCKINKPYNNFYKSKATKDGYTSQCKECMKQYCIINTDKIQKRLKPYRLANSDKHKKYMKQYDIDNATAIRKRKKQYYLDNIIQFLQYSEKRRKDNPEYMRQYGKEYRQTERGKLVSRKKTQKRRALIRNNTPVGKHWNVNDIILKLKLQKYKCVYCKISIKDYFEIDHIIPASKGGSNMASNIQLLCEKCNGNGGKGTKMPHEFAKKFNMLF